MGADPVEYPFLFPVFASKLNVGRNFVTRHNKIVFLEFQPLRTRPKMRFYFLML